jgi:hypothetical protein
VVLDGIAAVAIAAVGTAYALSSSSNLECPTRVQHCYNRRSPAPP